MASAINRTNYIKRLTDACIDHLLKQVREEERRDGVENAEQGFWASRQYAEFNLWKNRVRADEDGIGSLNLHLEYAPELLLLIERLLGLLERDLQELESLGLNEPLQGGEGKIEELPHHSWKSETSSPLSFMSLSSFDGTKEFSSRRNRSGIIPNKKKLLQGDIEDTIDRLQDHALQFQRAGAIHRQRRVSDYTKKNLHAFEGYYTMANFWAKSRFPLAADVIKSRIAESFAKRRIRFDYMEQHVRELQTQVNAAMPSDTSSSAAANSTECEAPIAKEMLKDDRVDSATLDPSNFAVPTAILSATENAMLERPSVRQVQQLPGFPESVGSIIARHPDLPPLPTLKDSSYQCPYCQSFVCQSTADKRFWSQHVLEDFEPYFCTVEDCEAPFDLENSFSGLLAHLQTHSVECYRISISPGQFKGVSKEDFEQYLEDQVSLSKDECETMRELCRHKDPYLFDTCPFCGCFPNEVQELFLDSDTIRAQIELRRHIRNHMHDISLIYQPYRPDVEGQWKEIESRKFSQYSGVENKSEGSITFEIPCTSLPCALEDRTELTWGDAESLKSPESWASFWPQSPPYADDNEMKHFHLENDKIMRHFAEVKDSFKKRITGVKRLSQTNYHMAEDGTTINSHTTPATPSSAANVVQQTRQVFPTPTPVDFTLAIFTAKTCEFDAVEAQFDGGEGEAYHETKAKSFTYKYGKIWGRNVLLIFLMDAGPVEAASSSQHLLETFENLQLILLVGVCAGVAQPPGKPNIFIGDVIIGNSMLFYGDSMRWEPSRISPRDVVKNEGPHYKKVSRCLGLLGTKKTRQKYLDKVRALEQAEARRSSRDRLFPSDYHHVHRTHCPSGICEEATGMVCDDARRSSCQTLGCSEQELITRNDPGVEIHVGPIASAPLALRSPAVRDGLARDYQVLAFEMEATGLWDAECPVVPIKGVSDFADSHKGHEAQEMAATMAACVMRHFVGEFFGPGKTHYD